MLPGLSFSPTGGQMDQPQQGGQNARTNPVQDAIKLLSFRLPTNVGQSAIGAQSVLGGQNAAFGSQLGAATAQQWLQRLFGGQMAEEPSGMPQAPQGGPQMPGSNPFMSWLNTEQQNGGQPNLNVTNAPGVNVDFHQPQPWRNQPMPTQGPSPLTPPQASAVAGHQGFLNDYGGMAPR